MDAEDLPSPTPSRSSNPSSPSNYSDSLPSSSSSSSSPQKRRSPVSGRGGASPTPSEQCGADRPQWVLRRSPRFSRSGARAPSSPQSGSSRGSRRSPRTLAILDPLDLDSSKSEGDPVGNNGVLRRSPRLLETECRLRDRREMALIPPLEVPVPSLLFPHRRLDADPRQIRPRTMGIWSKAMVPSGGRRGFSMPKHRLRRLEIASRGDRREHSPAPLKIRPRTMGL
uniref:Uncharacterized protein n=1 Tax=Ananas comosus var. bracteatus TaxID=296719 RepID=A0A6V7PK99_ANACO|nr:unnamed protein product [Ananas comosus var. bracteatus]